ncbi:MAG: GGDEF domain-containing protein [Steroidobacteraceae bacterium]
MLETIPTTAVSLLVYSLTLLIICVTTVYISGAPWAWIWLAASVCCVAWRTLHPLFARLRGRPKPLVSIMMSSGCAMASFGFGCAMSIRTGDIALTTMALSGTMGVMAGVATRWAALPRPAVATMLLSVAPPMLALAARGGPNVLAALALGFSAISIATFTAQNRDSLLASVTAGELLRRRAQTDHLTGLANRAELLTQMEDACKGLPASAGESDSTGCFAVLFVDLDGFKAVNDNHGHGAGDEVLQEVARRLQQVVGPEQTVARIGGDEFVVLLLDADPLTASGVADETIAAVSRDIHVSNGRTLRVGCSVGVCMAPEQGRSPEILLANADSALYFAKNQGKGQTGLFQALQI